MGGEVFARTANATNCVTDWNDFQPRFGFAYQFAPKWWCAEGTAFTTASLVPGRTVGALRRPGF